MIGCANEVECFRNTMPHDAGGLGSGWKLLDTYTGYKELWFAVTASLVLGGLAVATVVMGLYWVIHG